MEIFSKWFNLFIQNKYNLCAFHFIMKFAAVNHCAIELWVRRCIKPFSKNISKQNYINLAILKYKLRSSQTISAVSRRSRSFEAVDKLLARTNSLRVTSEKFFGCLLICRVIKSKKCAMQTWPGSLHSPSGGDRTRENRLTKRSW